MRRLLAAIAVAVAAPAGLPALAADNGGVELSVRSRDQAAALSAIAGKTAQAPFRTGRDPLPEILLREEQEARGGPRGACETTTSDFCYDLAGGRVVYRKARAYMPKIDGLRAESISLKRDRILFKYSF